MTTSKNKIFNDNPELKEFYATSDGTAFYYESDAKNHARTLENKQIEHCVRGGFVEKIPVKLQEAAKPEEDTAPEDEGNADADADAPNREELVERYIELFDKKPAANMKLETLMARIAEAENENPEENETED